MVPLDGEAKHLQRDIGLLHVPKAMERLRRTRVPRVHCVDSGHERHPKPTLHGTEMSYGPAFCRRRCKTLESHAQSLSCRQRERHCGSESTCDPLNHGLLFRPQTFHQSISLLLRRFCRHQQSCSFPLLLPRGRVLSWLVSLSFFFLLFEVSVVACVVVVYVVVVVAACVATVVVATACLDVVAVVFVAGCVVVVVVVVACCRGLCSWCCCCCFLSASWIVLLLSFVDVAVVCCCCHGLS